MCVVRINIKKNQTTAAMTIRPAVRKDPDKRILLFTVSGKKFRELSE